MATKLKESSTRQRRCGRPGKAIIRKARPRRNASLQMQRDRGLRPSYSAPAPFTGLSRARFQSAPIQFLRQGRLVLAGSGDLPSNTVYVDNVVYAILRALDAPSSVANGQAFLIGEGDDLTWGQFFGYFADRDASGIKVCSRRTGCAEIPLVDNASAAWGGGVCPGLAAISEVAGISKPWQGLFEERASWPHTSLDPCAVAWIGSSHPAHGRHRTCHDLPPALHC